MTSSTAILLVALALLFFAIDYFIPRQQSPNTTLGNDYIPYLAKNPLTQTEASFYHILVTALPEHVVLAQVQLSSFLKVDIPRSDRGNYKKWFNPIAQQSVDFLICEKDFSIIAAIELDDYTHDRVKAVERDMKKNKNLHAANVPLIRWHAEAMPGTEIIRQTVLNYVAKRKDTGNAEPLWASDRSRNYARQEQTPNSNIIKNIAIWCAIAVVMMAIYNFSWVDQPNQTRFLSSNTQFSNTQDRQATTINQTQEYLEKQQREHTAQESIRVRAQQAQQLINQQQVQQKLLQAREAALKEDAWNHYYKKTVECTSFDDMVKCGNTYIRNKQQFEYEWEHQRYKFK